MTDTKTKKVELEFSFLQRIAEYYDFPVAIFFLQPKDFPTPKVTRDYRVMAKAKAFDQIKEITEDVYSDY